ncbi:hypothetical protein B0H19DRAFT_1245103 [Mycena capillaripes]|nr:hypothetical protein B0H19DRAFT_1245103 [Mycena capillaripes]
MSAPPDAESTDLALRSSSRGWSPPMNDSHPSLPHVSYAYAQMHDTNPPHHFDGPSSRAQYGHPQNHNPPAAINNGVGGHTHASYPSTRFSGTMKPDPYLYPAMHFNPYSGNPPAQIAQAPYNAHHRGRHVDSLCAFWS